jgi:signal transduction histidine kinase
MKDILESMKFRLVPEITNRKTIWTLVGVLFFLLAILPASQLLSGTLFWILLLIDLAYIALIGWILGESLRKQMVYQKKLENINSGKDEFLSFATHQLRSPLTAFKWGLNAVQDALKDRPETAQTVQKLREISDEMIKTVNDLLDISKIEQGGLAMASDPVDLVEMIDRLAEEMRINAEMKHLSFSFKTDLPIAIISGDKTALRQVFVNIIDNAIKYTQKGSITIDLVYNAEKNTFEISVTDTGPGISAEEIDNLFEKFARGKAGQSSKGSGLGLYLGKKIAELHHGDIVVTSPGIGKGTTFIVSLPKPA